MLILITLTSNNKIIAITKRVCFIPAAEILETNTWHGLVVLYYVTVKKKADRLVCTEWEAFNHRNLRHNFLISALYAY